VLVARNELAEPGADSRRALSSCSRGGGEDAVKAGAAAAAAQLACRMTSSD